MPNTFNLEDLAQGIYRPGTRVGYNPSGIIGSGEYEKQLEGFLSAQYSNPTQFYNPNSPFYNPALAGNARANQRAQLEQYFRPPGQAAAPSGPENEFGQKLAQVVKNPAIENLTNRAIAEVGSFQSTASPMVRAAAQGQLTAATDLGNRLRSQAQQTGARVASDSDLNRQILDSFIQRFNAAIPELDTQTASQNRQLDRIFADPSDPNSVAAQQAGIRRRARTAEVDAILPEIDRAQLASQIRSGTYGVNRVNDINLRNTALQLSRDAAVRNAERESRDLNSLLGLQRSTAGLPQDIATTNLLRSRIPLDARLDVAGRELGLTGEALRQALLAESGTTSNLANAFALEQAADPLTELSRRTGLTGDILRNYLANNFLSVASRGPDLTYAVPGYRPSPSMVPAGYDPNDGADIEELLNYLMGGGGGGGLPPRSSGPGTFTPLNDYAVGNPDGTYNLTNDFNFFTQPRNSPLYYPYSPLNDPALGDFYESGSRPGPIDAGDGSYNVPPGFNYFVDPGSNPLYYPYSPENDPRLAGRYE